MKVFNRLVYYALGGGLGHLTRTRAIIEALLQRLPLDISLITNCPHYSLVFNNHKLTIAYVANQTELSIQLTKVLSRFSRMAQYLQTAFKLSHKQLLVSFELYTHLIHGISS